MKQWGFNVVRLYVAWEGYMPQRGVYNSTYLDQVETIVNILLSHIRCLYVCTLLIDTVPHTGMYISATQGISVILDAHQDVYTRGLYTRVLFHCYLTLLSVVATCGEGAANWTAIYARDQPVTCVYLIHSLDTVFNLYVWLYTYAYGM